MSQNLRNFAPMYKLGEYNELAVSRIVDFGVYLDGGDGTEILMPAKYIDGVLQIGDTVRVFVYTDSEDRPVATTERPYATVGQFAYMQVNQVNRVGAFLDWGLTAKELLVPYSEQRVKMRQGGIYLVYVYVDDNSQRVVASAKIDKFLGNVLPQYMPGDSVDALVISHDERGYRCIVDNLHRGIFYDNELYTPLEIGESVKAYVKRVRPDGKIDLRTTARHVRTRLDPVAERILQTLRLNGGACDLNDHTSPERIRALLECSKRDFKRAVGMLYRQHLINLTDGGIELVK